MKKIVSLLLAVIMMLGLLASCGTDGDVSSASSAPTTPTNVNIAVLKGPTGIGASKLLSDSDNGSTANKYTYTIAGDPTEVNPKLINGTFDIAAVPTNVAALLYNNNDGKVKMLAINTLSVLYVLEKGNTVTDIKSLEGKTVYISGKGATPEYAMRALLEKNDVKNVTLEFVDSHAELATMMASTEGSNVEICVLPEPQVTATMLKNKDVRVALDVNKLWKDAYGDDTALAMGCVVARTEFIEQNPEAVAKFLEEYKQSVEYVNENVDAAATICADLGLVGSAAAGKNAIPRCNIVCVIGDDMKPVIEPYFEVLKDSNAKSIGGKLPDDNFYYKK